MQTPAEAEPRSFERSRSVECPSVTPSCMSAIGSSTRRFQRTCPFSDSIAFDHFFSLSLHPRSLPSKRVISAHQAHSALISCSASARPLPSLPFPSLDPSSFSCRSRTQKAISAPSAGRQRRLAAGKRQLTAGKSRLRTTSSGFDDSFHRQTRWRSRCADESTYSMQHRRVTKGAACQAGGS